MVRRSLRSRSFRKVKVKTPGGKVVTHYRKRKNKIGICPVTGETLKGVPKARSYKMQNMAKTKKRPQRPFGGVLSSKAMRAYFKEKVNSMKKDLPQ